MERNRWSNIHKKTYTEGYSQKDMPRETYMKKNTRKDKQKRQCAERYKWRDIY